MKKNFINFTFLVFLILILINSFIYKNELSIVVVYSIKLFISNVFPYLFFTIIIQTLLINYNLAYYLNKILKNNSYDYLILILSIFGGCPTNAIIIKDLYNKNKINETQANKLLMSTCFNNPLFLYSILDKIFNNKLIAFTLIIINYLSNFIIFFINKSKSNGDKKMIKESPINFANILSTSIKNSLNTNIMVFGTITFFIIIAFFMSLLVKNNLILLFLKGFLEITQGLDFLIYYNLNLKIKELISILFISFTGLSIHLQVYNIIEDTNLKYNYFLKGRLLNLIYSSIITILCIAIAN
jgi:hypothetical protein